MTANKEFLRRQPKEVKCLHPIHLFFISFVLLYHILSYFTKFTSMYLILGEVSLVVGGVFVGLKRRGSHENP